MTNQRCVETLAIGLSVSVPDSSREDTYSGYVLVEFSHHGLGPEGLQVDTWISVPLPFQVTIDTEPLGYRLQTNYPNPFNGGTTIDYLLAKESDVVLSVFNVLGERVRTLVNMRQGKGWNSIQFEPGVLSSGVYIYRIQAGGFTASRKMMLLR